MVASITELYPYEVAVFEVFRRMKQNGLESPSMETLTRQTKYKSHTVTKACHRLVDLGLLVQQGSGRGRVPFKVSDSLDVSASSPRLIVA